MSDTTSSPISSAPALEAATRTFIDSLAARGGPPIYALSPAEARDVLAGAQAGPTPKLPAHMEDTIFPVGPTGATPVRIIRPEGAREPLPVVLFLHGGGWILGDRNTHDRLVREIAHGAHAAVVFVDFDRSPEVHYPVPTEQAYAVARYVRENAKGLYMDASRLAVVGDSVGGNMCAAVTLMAKERGGPKILFQVLFYPVTAADFATASYSSFRDGPWLTKAAMEWFWDAYLPEKAKRAEITASPLNATSAQLRDLPEALIVTAENDVLRDEGEAYAHKLSEAGVRVTALRYLGTIHDFVMLDALRETPAAKNAVAQACAALKTAFRQ